MNPDPALEVDPLGIACCHGCGATYCPGILQDRTDHAAYHKLVLSGKVTYTRPGQGPLRLLSDEITRARQRRRKEMRRP